jgi:hypothetical protein
VTCADGIEGIVLRYGGFYGPGTSIAVDPDVTQQAGFIEDVEPYGSNAAPGAGRSLYD